MGRTRVLQVIRRPEPGAVAIERARWKALFTVMLGSIAAALASTMIMVAVPAIGQYFSVGQAQVQWCVTAYMVAMTLSMLLTPWLLLRFGLRRTFMAAVVLLSLGSILSGASTSYPILLCTRVIEGIASGILQPIPAIVILGTFPRKQQGRAMGLYGLGIVVLPGIGPWVGGLFVQAMGWRSIFFVGVPICFLAIAMCRRHLPAASGITPVSHPFDWRGLFLLGVGVIALLNGLTLLRHKGASAYWMLLLGALGIAAFVVSQFQRGGGALIDMRLLGHRQFSMGALVSFTYGMSVFGSIYLLPVYFQVGLHFTSAQAGLVLMPAAAVLALTILWAGHLTDRYPPHLMIAGGLLVLFASLALMTIGASVRSYTVLIGLTILGRIGLGLILPALSLGAIRDMDPALVAQGSTTIHFVRQLGGAIGVNLVGIVLEWRLAEHAQDRSRGIDAGRIAAFDDTLLMVAGICAMSMVAALAMRPRPVDSSI